MVDIMIARNDEVAAQLWAEIQKNDGYCLCALEKTQDTKCMCKDFLDKVDQGYRGKCNCGLYIAK